MSGTDSSKGWEARLAALGRSGLDSREPLPNVEASDLSLERAFAYCAALTRRHSRTFYLASGFLPRPKRRAARALYGFCRVTDDIVDRAGRDPLSGLKDWEDRVMALNPPGDDAVALAWAKTRADHRIPSVYALQLVQGVGLDLRKNRYATFDGLAEYCYGVASTVGLMSMHIIGFLGPEAVPYAVKMGVALQLTNVLRDVGEDWRRGRVYLPQDELEAYGLGDEDIEAGRVDERWRAFMQFQIDRNRRLYNESRPGIALLDRSGQFAIAAAADLYCSILSVIEANGYDNFGRRAYVSLPGKLRRLPGIWWRLRRLRRQSRLKNGDR